MNIIQVKKLIFKLNHKENKQVKGDLRDKKNLRMILNKREEEEI